jgi:hypothetical protein
LEVIQPCFLVVDIATVAEGIRFTEGICKRTAGGKNVTPSVVGILDNGSVGRIDNRKRIALWVSDVAASTVLMMLQYQIKSWLF